MSGSRVRFKCLESKARANEESSGSGSGSGQKSKLRVRIQESGISVRVMANWCRITGESQGQVSETRVRVMAGISVRDQG